MFFEPNNAPIGWYENKNIEKIQQSEVAFSNNSSKLISSSGAGPCVILIIFDKLSKQGMMGHIFSSFEISPFSSGGLWLIEQCKKRYENGLLDFYLIGGYSIISSLLIHSIEQFIETLAGKIELNNIFSYLNQNWISNIVFDFEEGRIFNYEASKDFSPRRKLDCKQGLQTSFFHLCPGTHLIEYELKKLN
jgi:hypothetical protein